MNRKQRKQRLKDFKRKAKEAHLAQPDRTVVPNALNDGLHYFEATAGEMQQTVEAMMELNAPGDAVAEGAALVAAVTTGAKALIDTAKHMVTPEDAHAMLSRAAVVVDSVLHTVEKAIALIPEDRKREVLEVVRAKPDPEPLYDNAQQRPRRRPDPVVTLLRMAIQLASLQRRLIGRLFPNLNKTRKPA